LGVTDISWSRRWRGDTGITRIAEIYEGTVQVQLNTIVRILKKLNPDYITDRML
jgi:alkylation response protein AidB-like acyl-CoA dehydrogenase